MLRVVRTGAVCRGGRSGATRIARSCAFDVARVQPSFAVWLEDVVWQDPRRSAGGRTERDPQMLTWIQSSMLCLFDARLLLVVRLDFGRFVTPHVTDEFGCAMR